MTCGRYAPSPTGRLHLGNLSTALAAWLQARLSNGLFILRIDDLDLQRNKPGSLESIIDDLRWLGLDWDEGPDIGGPNAPYLQSLRGENYLLALNNLDRQKLVFRCYCSRRDITQALSAPNAGNSHPVYAGTCRPPNPASGGHPRSHDNPGEHTWRFMVAEQVVEFSDNILGHQQQQLEIDVGDFVVYRRDGLCAYQLANIVDDSDMGITDVVRGADLVDSTARQIALMQALANPIPEFWHVPLMRDGQGKRLSKRDGSDSLEQFRAQGKTAAQVVGLLSCFLGLIDQKEALSSAELLEHLDLDAFRRNLRITAAIQASG